jgi:hypothetical protein
MAQPPVPPDKFEVYRQILERAWADPDFKAELVAHPREVLAQYGIVIAPEENINVIQGSPSDTDLYLPDSFPRFIC